MSRATKRKATRDHHALQLASVHRAKFDIMLDRDQALAECGRLRSVVRHLEARLNIPESESLATVKPYRKDGE